MFPDLKDKFKELAKAISPVNAPIESMSSSVLKIFGWSLSSYALAIYPYTTIFPTAEQIAKDRKSAQVLQTAYKRIEAKNPLIPYTQKNHAQLEAHASIRACYLSAQSPSPTFVMNEVGAIETRYQNDTSYIKQCLHNEMTYLNRADLPSDASQAATYLKELGGKARLYIGCFGLFLVAAGAGLTLRENNKARNLSSKAVAKP